MPGLQGISARSPVTLREIEQGLILIADLLSFRNHFPFLKIFSNILSWQIGNLINLIFFNDCESGMSDVISVQNFTLPDFQAKNSAP